MHNSLEQTYLPFSSLSSTSSSCWHVSTTSIPNIIKHFGNIINFGIMIEKQFVKFEINFQGK